MSPWSEGVPSPGTQEGYDLGCTCARMDNNNGLYPPRPPHGWYVTAACPIHDTHGEHTLTVDDIINTPQEIGDDDEVD